MTAITDSTARIQQELDSEKKIIELKEDLYLISATLKIHSGQTLIAGKNTRFLLAPGSSCPLITNDGTDDRDICIEGGIWDYDNTKQAPNHWFGTDRLWTAEKYEESVPHGWVMKFRCVKGLTLRNMIIRNPASFSAALSDIDGFLVENIHFEQTTWNPEPLCMDGIHVNGNCHHGIIRNLTGKTYDDMVALNADDSWECSDSRGPITDILIENVTGDASYRFMRLQAIDSTVENIRIRNIRGSFGSTGVLLSLFYTELNKYSLYRNITIEDMDIEISFPGGDPYGENGGIVVDDMANVDGLTLRNIHCRMTNDEPPPVFHISADSSVINLVMENVSAERPGRVRQPRYLKKDDNYTNAFV